MIHNDHLGTPQKMTDASGQVVWAADYKPFGEVTVTVSTITNNLRFPGQYLDTETGLNYNYFRDFNPATGRYIEADPIGILHHGMRGGMNHLYTYVGNNPVNRKDPLGKFPLWIEIGIKITWDLVSPKPLGEGEDEMVLNRVIEEENKEIDQLEKDVAETKKQLEKLIEEEKKRTKNCS